MMTTGHMGASLVDAMVAVGDDLDSARSPRHRDTAVTVSRNPAAGAGRGADSSGWIRTIDLTIMSRAL